MHRRTRINYILGFCCFVALVTTAPGCHGDRDALQSYLAVDHPKLTEGAAEAVARFQVIVAADLTPAEKRARLQVEVLEPYAAVVERLKSYVVRRTVVRRHHDAYVDAARRQLHAFNEAVDALAAGRSLEGAAGILNVTRDDFERWMTQVRAEARDLGVRLTEPAG
ncbi:MAG: hypothetical protein ACI9OJ_004656 [Myxococcota bacterium]|jgi:hypothetical protein